MLHKVIFSVIMGLLLSTSTALANGLPRWGAFGLLMHDDSQQQIWLDVDNAYMSRIQNDYSHNGHTCVKYRMMTIFKQDGAGAFNYFEMDTDCRLNKLESTTVVYPNGQEESRIRNDSFESVDNDPIKNFIYQLFKKKFNL